MDVTIESIDKTTYIVIRVVGRWTLAAGELVIRTAREEADKRNVHRILIDILALTQPEEVFTRYDTGLHIASLLGYPYRTASLESPGAISHLAENVATNRGARMKSFTDENEALEWLLQSEITSGQH